ncbi:type II secretion system protein [Candidatus Wolfebacteria bacterium]|nr:type II secretion system protein [Candidatus Wolfebacteria bacterium]
MKKGFTLIEILIVVAIIGLLTSVVLVGLGSFRQSGRDARRIADLRETQNALELYYAKYYQYPNPAIPEWSALETALIGAEIGVFNLSNDPIEGRTYEYGVAGDLQSYVLGATLEDGENNHLDTDIEGGDVYGVNCEDPVYCVQF